MGLASPGITYTGSVTLPQGTEGGAFGFVQIVNADITNTNSVSGPHTLVTVDVLDNYPFNPPGTGPTDPGYLQDNTTIPVPAGGTGTTVGNNALTDQVGVGPILGPGDFATQLQVDIQVTTYLVFQPAGGIWVALMHTPTLTLNGNQQWNINNGWTPVTQPSASPAGPLMGVGSPEFLSWGDYWTNASRPANWVPNF